MFEEWIAYRHKRIFIPERDHSLQSSQQGWWLSGWRGDAAAVKERKAYYAGLSLVDEDVPRDDD